MKNYIVIFFAGCLLLVTSCKKKNKTEETTDPPTTTSPTTPPVETNPPNSSYTPAFTGQTRIRGVGTTTSYNSQVLTSSLTAPWELLFCQTGVF